eukprot:13950722-Heterocapsa_arctica.AAC.1
MLHNPGVPWDREAQPPGEREPHRNPVHEDDQISTDPTFFGWSPNDKGNKGSNRVGTEGTPINSQ